MVRLLKRIAAVFATLVVLYPIQSAARVAVTSATDGEPRGKPPAEVERILRIGIDVQANEVITTGPNDRAHLVFLDGSSVTVGPNAVLKVDKFVYDPATQKGALSMSAGKGVLRIVGGKISKSAEIVIETPSASMGIRGGITLAVVEPDKATFTFVHGIRMRVTARGRTEVAGRPGWQVTVDRGAPPAQPTLVGQAALKGALAQLDGRAGTSGRGQTEQGAENFEKQNSGQGTGQPTTTTRSSALSNAVNAATNAVANATDSSAVTPKQAATPTPATRVIVSKGRFVADPAYSNFNSATLGVTPNATNNQLLASAATVTNDKQVTIGLSDGRSITLPWQTNTLKTGFSIGTYNDPTFGTISGAGYVSESGDFFAYVFTDSSNKRLGFIGGTPTPAGGLPSAGIASYDLGNHAGSARLPFADTTVGDDPALQATKVVSKLYAAFSPQNPAVVGQAVPGSARSTAMQATISVNGLGVSQKSYAGVFIGEFFSDSNNGSPASSGGFNASYRLNSVQQIGRLTSAASTPEAGGGTNAIYGPNGNAVVFTPDKLTTTTTSAGGLVTAVSTVRTPQASLNQPITNLAGTDYYSVNVATLATTPSGVGQTRTSETLQGYVGGVVEQQGPRSASSSTRSFGTDGNSPSDVTITKDATSNRASASIVVQRWDSADTSATFRLGGTTGASYATSSFIDNNTYAVRDRDPALFSADTTSSVTSRGTTSSGAAVTSRTTIVSYPSAPTANLFAASGVTPCTCDYLSWGWWSGTVSYSNASGYNAGGVDRLNLATYVVGTVTPAVQLPNTGTATYNGHMIGNVVNGTSSYVAAGSYASTWSFAAGSGTVSASFDGANFSGGLARNTANPSSFSHVTPIASTGVPAARSLTLNGSFFSGGPSNPVSSQAGSFAVAGPNYKAGGIFAGQKVP